jgi:hypothetical protein
VLSCRRADGLHREVGLTWQKSAEVIVPAGMKASREGPNVK